MIIPSYDEVFLEVLSSMSNKNTVEDLQYIHTYIHTSTVVVLHGSNMMYVCVLYVLYVCMYVCVYFLC